ncbi:retinoid-inducible serine carboxypeptidase-like [Trichogramma pretiosum]|uniref:retinoid-inducible serine carboxypeptidase-like n=1 Tax=Trichogramma pretiosum TaxID=7493 RepID=UPI0006C9A6FE|nr:retinoid-inducible serine carboxypeptidase-like [Trichogramma pretiosum]
MTPSRIVGLTVACILYICNVQAKRGVGDNTQDWGYAEVRPGAHMFWWLYYANVTTDFAEKPLVIWLQGGPGASSTGYGNFMELGPLDVNLNPRNHTWVRDYNVLFIDNPVGSGFSYVTSSAAFARTNAQIADDLVECMRAFYKQVPQFRNVPVYITSESYGGKMAAEFAFNWYKAEKAGSIKSNLKGVGLGDAWISPEDSVMTYAPYLLQTGMVDTSGYFDIQRAANRTRDAVKTNQWSLATNLWAYTENVIMRVTRNIDFYNILTKVRTSQAMRVFRDNEESAKSLVRETVLRDGEGLNMLMNTKVKDTLKLPSIWGAQSDKVFNSLYADFMKPVTQVVQRLLDETNLKVFVYSGQLDLIVDTPGTLLWVEKMRWARYLEWKTAQRVPVVVDGVIEGYQKSSSNFAFYWINRAGHMVPADNPAGMSALLADLTQN